MAAFLKVTDRDTGNPYLINVDEISYLKRSAVSRSHSIIVLKSGQEIYTKEPLEDLFKAFGH